MLREVIDKVTVTCYDGRGIDLVLKEGANGTRTEASGLGKVVD